jgi:hypothetical protein
MERAPWQRVRNSASSSMARDSRLLKNCCSRPSHAARAVMPSRSWTTSRRSGEMVLKIHETTTQSMRDHAASWA